MTVDEAFSILHSLPREWGTSEVEVRDVESKLGVSLPAALRELMLCTGDLGHMEWLFPGGSIAALAELPSVMEAAAEILEDEPTSRRPAFPFVALSEDQGYFFSLVQADALEADPKILGYMHGSGITSDPTGETLRQTIAMAVMNAVSRA